MKSLNLWVCLVLTYAAAAFAQGGSETDYAVYVQVPSSWSTKSLVFSPSNSRSVSLSDNGNDWYVGSYTYTSFSDIGASSRTFTISDGTSTSYFGNISDFANAENNSVWIVVDDYGHITITGSDPSIITSSNSYGNSSSSRSLSGSHYVRFLNPWTSTTPSIVTNGTDTTKMSSVSNYCGWYQTRISSDITDVIFVQTVGPEVFTASGAVAGLQIALDSIFSISDTVWINSKTTTGLPEIFSSYPRVLGDCPIRDLGVTVYDWYDGSKNNAGRWNPTTKGVAVGGTGTSADFGGDDNDHCWPNNTPDDGQFYNDGVSVITGMVEKSLGANGVPVRNESFDWAGNCTNATHLNRWFLPETTVVNGVIYTNASCKEITLELEDSTGMWLGQMDRDGSTGSVQRGGAFLLDSMQYLDPLTKQVVSPWYDSINSGWSAGDGRRFHNYGLSMKIQASFVYVPGQTFDFYGDDDVWVFINNQLVVDIGGVHDKRARGVDLDTLGLVEGETYSFNIFYTERFQVEGNFRMRTSMDLHTDRTYFHTDTDASGVKTYEIWQRVSTQGLACDMSTSTETKAAVSSFVLTGGNLSADGVSLNSAGLYYGGIAINEGLASFTIDTAAIVQTHGLASGVYTLTFSLRDDPTLSDAITFTVPGYALPALTFTDANWNAISDSTINGWANVAYPFYVALTYDTTTCELYLSTQNPQLIFLDSLGNQITSVMLQSGKARFYVMGTDSVTGALFNVAGAAIGNVLTWSGINLSLPPVPTLQTAYMSDRTGEGTPDSLYVTFSKALQGDDALDSIQWIYGNETLHLNKLGSWTLVDTAAVVIVAPDGIAGFTNGTVFTGLQGSVYTGSATAYFTYSNEPFPVHGLIADKVGPVILSATVENKDDDIVVLTINVSESLADNDVDADLLLQYWRGGSVLTTVHPSSVVHRSAWVYDLYYHILASELPSVGDSVRFAPRSVLDLGGAVPHLNNPWIRVVGDQKATVTSSTIVTVTPETASSEDSPVTDRVLVETGANADSLAQITGHHGQVIDYNMGTLLANENEVRGDSLPKLTAADVSIYYEVYYYTSLGGFVNSSKGIIACSDSIFGGDCTAHPGSIFLSWNMRSNKGRIVGTGAYIANLEMKVRVGNKVVSRKSVENVWGVRRGSGLVQQ